MLIKKKLLLNTTTKNNTEKSIGIYRYYTVQEILEIRHSQFEILTDNRDSKSKLFLEYLFKITMFKNFSRPTIQNKRIENWLRFDETMYIQSRQ